MENDLAPICLFTYNRLNETKLTIEALKNNYLAKDSELFIFSDGAKNKQDIKDVIKVRAYIKTIIGFKKVAIIESEENKGLANSIINGVTKIIDKYSKVIVLEDDLQTTPNFLDFMNKALSYYYRDKNIYAVNGYSLFISSLCKQDSIYFHKRACSWGWGTWDDRWNKEIFDKTVIRNKISEDKKILKKFEKEFGADVSRMLIDNLKEKNNSWYIRWIFYNFIKQKSSVFSSFSKVENIGFISNATNCNGISVYKTKLDYTNNINFEFINYKKNSTDVDRDFLKYFSMNYKIMYRLRLLQTSKGRRLIYLELLKKIKL